MDINRETPEGRITPIQLRVGTVISLPKSIEEPTATAPAACIVTGLDLTQDENGYTYTIKLRKIDK